MKSAPNMSVGGKGRPGPQTGARGFQCGHCEDTLASREGLREHSLRKHSWDIQTGAVASPEVLQKLREKDVKKAEKRGKRKQRGISRIRDLESYLEKFQMRATWRSTRRNHRALRRYHCLPGNPVRLPLPLPIHLLNVLLSLHDGTTLPVPLIKPKTRVRRGG